MSIESITVSARVGFATVHHITERLKGMDSSNELTLPYKYDWWKEAVLKFDEMLSLLQKTEVTVAMIHATQAKISDQDFLRMGF